MKKTIFLLMAMFVLFANIATAAPKKAKVNFDILEEKGTSFGIKTPAWLMNFIEYNISKVEAMPEFKDKYCFIGTETGVNKQFVLAWADSFTTQQAIASMVRTNVASELEGRTKGSAASAGGAFSADNAGELQKEIEGKLNVVVNVSYSGARREADWWQLVRTYDPKNKKVYNDEYRAYVLYTIPKAELNRQVARALETSISKDSVLYDITIELVKKILQTGFDGAE